MHHPLKVLLATFLIFLAFTQTTHADDSFHQIHAGKVIDVEKGVVLENQVITVHRGRIEKIGPLDKNPLTKGYLNWSEYTVLPGLIDGHTHLVGDIQSGDVLAPLNSSEAEDVAIGVKNALITLKAGFTSVIDVGSYQAFTDLKLKSKINRGEVPGPRMWGAGAYITIPGGGGEVVGLDMGVDIPDNFRAGVASNEKEVRERVNYLLDGGVDFIKVIATGAVLTQGTEAKESEFSEAEIRAAVEEAAKRGKYVTAHAHGTEGIKMAIRAGVRSIQHASLIDDEGLQLMNKQGTWLVADIYNGDYINEVGERENWPEDIMRKNRETTDAQRRGFEKAVKIGVNIAFGTDAGVFPHGLNPRQFRYMVRHGMTEMQAIQSATIQGAKAMGLEADIGSIRKGKFADLIAIKGDPLKDISLLENVIAVVKGGILVK